MGYRGGNTVGLHQPIEHYQDQREQISSYSAHNNQRKIRSAKYAAHGCFRQGRLVIRSRVASFRGPEKRISPICIIARIGISVWFQVQEQGSSLSNVRIRASS